MCGARGVVFAAIAPLVGVAAAAKWGLIMTGLLTLQFVFGLMGGGPLAFFKGTALSRSRQSLRSLCLRLRRASVFSLEWLICLASAAICEGICEGSVR